METPQRSLLPTGRAWDLLVQQSCVKENSVYNRSLFILSSSPLSVTALKQNIPVLPVSFYNFSVSGSISSAQHGASRGGRVVTILAQLLPHKNLKYHRDVKPHFLSEGCRRE